MFAPALTLLAMLLPATSALAQTGEEITVQRAGSQKPTIGAAQNFTGSVRVDGPFRGSAPARVSGGTVTFEPRARTAWHRHPLGQTLIVTSGLGLVQHWGGAIQEIHPGDVVWVLPGVKHWHGAAATTGMTHVAISEALDGKTVEWLEHVTDEQYRR
ncbi:cupin domain-containing protein [Bosea sp. 685]|uniref:(R)-mandelonitrile lyase n=1 Tax=Bosea sp. 685 TaxID=3080057 RepID=UPI0028932D5B|nr:cupin domain-containing protein [Bosea sp. 685]WNJ93552.1 cupin domain-containing protein [Bosea sp. 685]